MYNPTKPYNQEILRLIKSTWVTPYVTVTEGLYPVIHKKFSCPEIQHTDGIGTKGIYHWKHRTFKEAVGDALAMNLNDLAMAGAVPYALQNHIVLPEDDHEAIRAIISALVRESRMRAIAMTGGETSVHEGTEGLDISITISGMLKKPFTNQCRAGDTLLGLKSSGLHSNGITKARSVFAREHRKEFTVPTVIYADTVASILAHYPVHGMMHITGGAFTKIKDILGATDAVIVHPTALGPQPIFRELYRRGISNADMYSTFNCGIGFILSVPPAAAMRIIRGSQNAAIIGKVVPGSGAVEIHSAFNGAVVTL